MFEAPDHTTEARRASLNDALRKLEKELANLQSAVADGQPPATLLSEIRERERRQRIFREQVKALDSEPAIRAAAPQIRQQAIQLLSEWRGLLGKHVTTSRQLLRKLLDRERFVFIRSLRALNGGMRPQFVRPSIASSQCRT